MSGHLGPPLRCSLCGKPAVPGVRRVGGPETVCDVCFPEYWPQRGESAGSRQFRRRLEKALRKLHARHPELRNA